MTSSTAARLPPVCFFDFFFFNNHCFYRCQDSQYGIQIPFVAGYREVKALNDRDVSRGSATSREEERQTFAPRSG